MEMYKIIQEFVSCTQYCFAGRVTGRTFDTTGLDSTVACAYIETRKKRAVFEFMSLQSRYAVSHAVLIITTYSPRTIFPFSIS